MEPTQTDRLARPEPVLDLDAFVEHQAVTLGGRAYELVNHDELSILETRRLKKQSEQLMALEALADPTEDQVEEHKALCSAITGRLLRAPAAVIAGMTTRQHAQVIRTFVAGRPRPVAGAATASGPETTPESSSGAS